jgi:hypothetical protein
MKPIVNTVNCFRSMHAWANRILPEPPPAGPIPTVDLLAK